MKILVEDAHTLDSFADTLIVKPRASNKIELLTE